MDQPKIERVLRLMRLMSGVRHYTIEELAEALDTSSRSIYRYIDTFREVGYVVTKEYHYSISASAAFIIIAHSTRFFCNAQPKS